MKPCAVCGMGTPSIYGVCQRAKPCRQERARVWRLTNPRSQLVINVRRRARLEGVTYGLSPTDIPAVPDRCPCCGRELKRGGGRKVTGPARNQWPTLDKIDPALGYVPGNVQWLCYRCNRLKSNATPEELMRVALFMNREVS